MTTEYGQRLKQARNYAGLTQKQAEKKTSIPQSTISTAERLGNGSSETPVYAKAYGVDAHWLATGKGEMATLPASQEIDLDNNPDYPSIRRVHFKLSAGASGFGIDYEGELVIKRLVRDEGAWWLSSDNPDQRRYPRKRMTQDCFVIGQIVHKQSERI